MEKLYKADEVAELLQCSARFVYEHKDELGAVKIGNLIRFPESRLTEVVHVNVEARQEVVLPVQISGPVRDERSGIRKSARGKGSAGGEARGSRPDRSDPHGLHQSLQKSLGRARIEKGSLILVR